MGELRFLPTVEMTEGNLDFIQAPLFLQAKVFIEIVSRF